MRRLALGTLALVIMTSPAPAARAQSPELLAQERLTELESFLAGIPQGAGWRRYLQLEVLQRELAASEPDARLISQVLTRLRGNQPGLDARPVVRLRRALERWAVQSENYNQQLPVIVREAQFTPPAAEQVAQRRQQVAADLARLQTELGRWASGAGWNRFLQLDALQAQLQAETPDLVDLEDALARLESGHQGLELPPFRRLAESMRQYLMALRATATPDIADVFQNRMAELSEALERQAAGELDDLAPVVNDVAWLNSTGLARDAVTAIENRFPFKNVFVTVSDDVIEAGYAERQRDVQMIRENVDGTQVSGTATTDGKLTVRLIPSETQAMWDALFVGVTTSQTLGRNRSARINLLGHTDLVGAKRIVLDGNGPRALPATASASTDLRTTGIGSTVGGIRGCIVERVATRRVAESLPRAEQTTSRRAENELRQRLEERSGPQLAEAQREFWNRFRRPLAAKGLYPDDLLFSTTNRYLSAAGTFTGPARLGAPSLPPAWNEVADLGLIIHETAMNGMAQSYLAGETFHSETVRDEMGDMLGALPDRFAQDEEGEPWSITFANRDPITVRLRDNGMSITVRGQRYTSGDRAYRAMNVTAHYRFESRPNGIEAIRQEELEIFPPGFVPGERRLSVAEQTLRRMLERRMGRIFAEELGVNEVELPRNFGRVGPLVATQMQTGDGWLLGTWRKKSDVSPARTASR